MNPINSPFTAIYARWLESFRAMIPGGKPSAPPEELTAKQEQAAAHQEWEDEGGSIKPPARTEPVPASVPKIPF